MTDTIRADIDELFSLSKDFQGLAGRIGRIDTRAISAGAAEGFPGGAAIVEALAAVESGSHRAVSLLADRAWSTSDTIDWIAADYENTDEYFAAGLARAVPE